MESPKITIHVVENLPQITGHNQTQIEKEKEEEWKWKWEEEDEDAEETRRMWKIMR